MRRLVSPMAATCCRMQPLYTWHFAALVLLVFQVMMAVDAVDSTDVTMFANTSGLHIVSGHSNPNMSVFVDGIDLVQNMQQVDHLHETSLKQQLSLQNVLSEQTSLLEQISQQKSEMDVQRESLLQFAADIGSYSTSVSLLATSLGEQIANLQQPKGNFINKFAARDVSVDDRFGSAIAAYGDVVVVGSPGYSLNTKKPRGCVYCFRSIQGGGFEILKKIEVETLSDDAEFGTSVALDSELTLVVGAWKAKEGKNKIGKVFMFRNLLSASPTSMEIPIPTEEQDTLFGAALAMQGNLLAVGASGKAGKVYIFHTPPNSTTFLNAQTIEPTNAEAGDKGFGSSLCLNGNTLLIGASEFDGKQGKVYVYEQFDETFAEKAIIVPSVRTNEDLFGSSIYFVGTTWYIGSTGKNDYGRNSGAVYKFTAEPAYSFSEEAILIASDCKDSSLFGSSLAIDGQGNLLVGASGDDDRGESAGSMYVLQAP